MTEATSGELAELFGCSTRQIEALAQKGIIVRLSRGRYDRDASTTAYIRHLREQAASRAGQDPTIDSVTANVLWKQASTELLQVRLAKEAGELVDVEDVKALWDSIMTAVRGQVLGIPGAFAFEEPSLTPYARQTLERICRERLTDAAMDRGYNVASVNDSATRDGDYGSGAGDVAEAAAPDSGAERVVAEPSDAPAEADAIGMGGAELHPSGRVVGEAGEVSPVAVPERDS
jgi:phage terminase Nu1 subunit (DNA packaging protein)